MTTIKEALQAEFVALRKRMGLTQKQVGEAIPGLNLHRMHNLERNNGQFDELALSALRLHARIITMRRVDPTNSMVRPNPWPKAPLPEPETTDWWDE